MTNIYGKIDCYSTSLVGTVVDVQRISNETYVGFFKFLEYLQTQGETELVTYYSGSAGSGTGKDYWDTANAAGGNAFSVWKMKANGERNWDWYLYIHGQYTATNLQLTANSTPTRIVSVSSDVLTTTVANSMYGVHLQAAFSLSGSLTTNPWNGTINLSGAATKASEVWSTGSSGYTVHVFPRINNLSGSTATEKDCLAPLFYNGNGPNYIRTRYSFLYDGHGICCFTDTGGTNNPPNRFLGSFCYAGPYRLTNGIASNSTGSILGGTSSLGFVLLSSNAESAANGTPSNATSFVLPEYTQMGSLTPVRATPTGGAFATSQVGVRTFRLANDNTFVTAPYFPNDFCNIPGSSYKTYEERIYTIFCDESPYAGAMGWIDSPLIRSVVGDLYMYDLSPDKKRMVISNNTKHVNGSSTKITVPWDGTSFPGTVNSRNGTTFSYSNYTW